MTILMFVDFSKKLFHTLSSKLKLTHVNNDSKIFVVIVVRFRCTTNQSNSFSFVNYPFTRNEKIILTNDNEHIYRRFSFFRKEKNNIFLLFV